MDREVSKRIDQWISIIFWYSNTCTHSEIKLVKANKNVNSNTSNTYENKE